jgi:hypothetical protein
MSIRDKLKKITEAANKNPVSDSDVISLGNSILINWMPRSMDAANEKKKEIELLLFTPETAYNGRYVIDMVHDLIKYVESQTDLTAKLSHFLLEKSSRQIEQYDSLAFSENEEFRHFYLISLNWFD